MECVEAGSLRGSAGLVVFILTMPSGCNDIPGPAWERCSWGIGTPSPIDWGAVPDIIPALIPFTSGTADDGQSRG